MNILVACEFSGIVRDAFRARGHNAFSCDFKPCEGDSTWHIQDDVLNWLDRKWDLMIAHPTCRYLCSSGLFRNRNNPSRQHETELALEFVRKLMRADIRKKCIENPVGRISTAIRKPDQIIHPNQFGHDASKATCLWLEGLEMLVPTEYIQPRIVDGKPRWSNQTDSGQNRLAPSEGRSDDRSRTYLGIALAMAAQWG